jgi:hypothetical protein|tara:strand:- start:4537 stop:5220 length:684 start_codon:yes stop_codon:yes gene_type:complete
MPRLIAFGCSNTYGQGLTDCHIPPGLPGKTASKTSWPNTIGNLLKCSKVINQSVPGASNKLIWKTIVDFKFKHGDLVFINWTHSDRHCFFTNDQHMSIGPWIKNTANNFYYKVFYSETDSILDFFNRADHSKRYLDSLGLISYHTATGHNTINAISKAPKWFSVDFMNTSLHKIRQSHPLALDNLHAGQGAHDQFANELFLEIFEGPYRLDEDTNDNAILRRIKFSN